MIRRTRAPKGKMFIIYDLIILVIADPERLLPTVQSRFHKIYFSPVQNQLIKNWLIEELGMPALKAGEIASKSFGEPGLAWRILKDEEFGKLLGAARKFLVLRSGERKDFVKNLVDDEGFDFGAFLEAVMIALAPPTSKNISLWHRLLALRRDSDFFNLNPRLQLAALSENLR